MKILSGSSNLPLAKKIASNLDSNLVEVELAQFPNGEKRVWVKESLENHSVAIVQSFSDPVDEHIIELCLLIDAVKNLKAKKIIAVIPWFGYSPQDKLFRTGEPISAQVIARLVESVGLDHVVIADIHSHDSLKFFTIPTTHVSALPIFTNCFSQKKLNNFVTLALDKGAVERAQSFAAHFDLPVAYFKKVRDGKTGKVTFKHLKGDITGKKVISFDDFVSTGSTRIQAAQILKTQGATYYIDCITHAILAGNTHKLLQLSLIDKIFVTDTYPIPSAKHIPKMSILSSASTLAQSIKAL